MLDRMGLLFTREANGGQRAAGQGTVSFGNGADTVVTTVVDPGVDAGSVIVPTIAIGADREQDELEFVRLEITVGTIVPGVGFDLIVTDRDADADGDFVYNYVRF